jgi:hypothetical protein
MSLQYSNPSINLGTYLNRVVEIKLLNGKNIYGELYKSNKVYYCSKHGYWDDCGKYTGTGMGECPLTLRESDCSIKSIKLMTNIKDSQPHSVSKPKIQDPVYWDIQNQFPLGEKPSAEKCKKILESILDRPELFWRTFAFFDTDVIEDTEENREVYFHIMQRINLWLYKAMYDCDTGTFKNSFSERRK